MPKAKKPKGGRPRKEIDPADLQSLVRMQCTAAECAAFFEISIDTLDRRIKEMKDEDDVAIEGFADYYKRQAPHGKASLRRLQWASAHRGSVTMQIWLGKQMLDQRDKQDHEFSGPEKGPIETINWDEISAEAKRELLKASRMLTNADPNGK